MKKKQKTYAKVMWTPEDVKTIRENWSLESCEECICDNERYIVERLIELGWDVISNLITQEDDKKYNKPNSVKLIKKL